MSYTDTHGRADKLCASVTWDASESSVHIGCVDAADRVAAVTADFCVCMFVCALKIAHDKTAAPA